MFLNRKTELELLNQRYKSSKTEFLILYGRRRVGKTELLRQFIKNKSHIYFMADQRPESEQLESFSFLLSEFFNDEILREQRLKNWDLVFSYIESKVNNNQKLILIFDEFPYLAYETPSITSIIQRHWDRELRNKNIFLILCGSSMSFMEKEILGYKSPLYGRRTGQLEILPFSFFETKEMFPDLNNEQIMEVYAICGGIPAYLEQISEGKSIWHNISEHIFKRDELLYNEVNFLLLQELRTPKNYFAILRAIALGNTKLNEIVQISGLERQAVSKYLDNLIELRIVERRIPAFENPLKSRKGLYFIKDNYFRFWFRFIYPYLTLIEEGRTDFILQKVKEEFLSYQGKIFEEVCIDYLKKNPDIIPFPYSFIGQWWDKDHEIDVVITDEKQNIIVGECKYSNKLIGTDILDGLVTKANKVNQRKEQSFILFSKKGFTENLIHKQKKERLRLIKFSEF